MRALDTNVLVRFLVGDDERQAKKVYMIFKQAEKEKEQFFVPLIVILELLWVLESAYDVTRQEILEAIGELILMPVLKIESLEIVHQFIKSARKSSFDLSELLIGNVSRTSGCDKVLTFDKKASVSELFELIK